MVSRAFLFGVYRLSLCSRGFYSGALVPPTPLYICQINFPVGALDQSTSLDLELISCSKFPYTFPALHVNLDLDIHDTQCAMWHIAWRPNETFVRLKWTVFNLAVFGRPLIWQWLTVTSECHRSAIFTLGFSSMTRTAWRQMFQMLRGLLWHIFM